MWQKQLCNVVVDVKLIDLKDCLPEGFTPIQDTMDTRKHSSHLFFSHSSLFLSLLSVVILREHFSRGCECKCFMGSGLA